MKNKKSRIIVDIILIILGIIFLVFGIKDAIDMVNSSKIDDAVLFKKDYSYVSEENVYKFITLKKTDQMLSNGTGMILISKPNDSWTQVLVEPLNEIAKSKNSNIYYLDIENIDVKSKYYKNILSLLEVKSIDNLILVFVKDGNIKNIYYKDDIYNSEYEGAPIDYWNKELKQQLKINITNDIESIN